MQADSFYPMTYRRVGVGILVDFLHRLAHYLCCFPEQARLTLEDGFSATIRKDIGPINLQFQIPMLCASKLQVRYLQIMKVRYASSEYRVENALCDNVVNIWAHSSQIL